MKKHYLTLLATTLIAASLSPAPAQAQTYQNAEQPTTLRMRVDSMETRYANAVSELVGTFERVATDPSIISSKEVVKAIDLGDRALKNTKSSCASILKALDAKTKSIESEPSFTEDQKAELLAAVESMTIKVAEVSTQCATTIDQLEGAYKAMGKWRTIHKTYLDLDGEAKAMAQLKASVDEFIKALTAEPGAFDAVPIKDIDEEKSE